MTRHHIIIIIIIIIKGDGYTTEACITGTYLPV